MTAPIETDDGRFSHWQILGQGGLGETWSALDGLRGRRVVVKTRDRIGASREMCLREADLARTLSSPHLQKFVAFLPGDPGPDALIYDFVPGQSLRDHMKTGPVPRRGALGMARDILTGLAEMHRKGIVHRDVSPENIILTDTSAVLIDFDALGRLDQDSSHGRTTIVGEFAGKPRYMSPEQITGAPQSAASDIWGVGAVLYETLTDRSFRVGNSIGDLLAEYASAPDVSAAPASLRGFLAELLAPDPAQRPDAVDAIAMIEAALDSAVATAGEEDPFAHPVPPPASAADVGHFASARASPSPRPRQSKRSRAGLFLAITTAALMGMAGLFFVGVLGGQDVGYPPSEGPFPPLPPVDPFSPALLVSVGFLVVGVGLVICSFFVAGFIRSRAAESDIALPYRAMDLINAPDARDRLTETICLRIDAYRELAGKQAEDMLSVTMVALANEYAAAETADERFRALEMLNELHAKVARSLRPWWMNYETLIARALSLTTLVAGIVAAIEGVRRLF